MLKGEVIEVVFDEDWHLVFKEERYKMLEAPKKVGDDYSYKVQKV
jgi:hypothetical protein